MAEHLDVWLGVARALEKTNRMNASQQGWAGKEGVRGGERREGRRDEKQAVSACMSTCARCMRTSLSRVIGATSVVYLTAGKQSESGRGYNKGRVGRTCSSAVQHV